MVALKTLIFTILVPGTLLGIGPWLLLQSSGEAVMPSLSVWLIGLLLPFSYSKVCNHPERSVVPASSPTARAREPLDQPSRFGLTPTPQAFIVRS